MAETVICSAKRTSMGGFQGELSGPKAKELGAVAIRGALLQALEQRDLKHGVAVICIGGGEVLAVVIERE